MSIDGMSDGMEAGESVETSTQPEEVSVRETMERAYDNAQPAEAPRADGPEDDFPQSYKADFRQHWQTLPPEAKQYLTQREREAHTKISELGQVQKSFESFKGVTERFKHRIPDGMAEHQAYEYLLAAQDLLEENPEHGIRMLAESYGVNLGAMRDDGRAQADNRKQLVGAIEKFKGGKEHWAELEEDMIDQIHALRARDPHMPAEQILQQAYDRAMRVNQNVWQQVESKRQAEAQAKEFEENKKRADAAKRAASLNVRGSHASPAKSGSWQDTMRAVADRVYR